MNSGEKSVLRLAFSKSECTGKTIEDYFGMLEGTTLGLHTGD